MSEYDEAASGPAKWKKFVKFLHNRLDIILISISVLIYHVDSEPEERNKVFNVSERDIETIGIYIADSQKCICYFSSMTV